MRTLHLLAMESDEELAKHFELGQGTPQQSRPTALRMEGMIDKGGIERDRERRPAARRRRRLPLAMAGVLIAILIAITVLSGRQPANDPKARELIGTWEADAELTRTLPENQSLDREELRSDSWLFAIQMKMRQAFRADGRYTFESRGGSSEFTYRVVTRDDARITLESQIVVDSELVRFAEEGAFAPFESEWLILREDRIANKKNGESGEFWMVFRRIDPES